MQALNLCCLQTNCSDVTDHMTHFVDVRTDIIVVTKKKGGGGGGRAQLKVKPHA